MATFLYPPSTSVSTSPSTGSTGTAAPAQATEVAGVDGGGVLRAISTDNTGNQNVNVISSALPSGAATSANQSTANTSLASIDGKTPPLGQQLAAASRPVVLTAAQITTLTPLSTVTANQGTGGASAWKVDGSGVTQPVSGTVTAVQATAANLNATVTGAVSVSNFPGTQPVSGTVTATQTTGSNLHTVVDSGTIAVTQTTAANLAATVTQGPAGASAWKVDGSGVTQPISASALPLPAGAATSANQTTELGYLSTLAGTVSGGVQASKLSGSTIANAPIYNQYGTTPITTGTYVQLVASTTAVTNTLNIFDSSGQAMILATGASGSEVIQAYIQPGGKDELRLSIPAGTRIAYKALTATANTSGSYLLINFLQ